MFATVNMSRPITKLARHLFVLSCALAWAGASAAQDIPTPATDPVLAKQLAAMAEQPGVTELGWRHATEAVPGTDAEAFTLDAASFPAPDALARARSYHEDHSGLGLLVWHRGALVERHYAEGVDGSTLFSGFSMHKSVLSLALLAAIEDGIIGSLDDTVGRYIPEWEGDPRGAITLRQLMQQTSGLAHFPFSSGDPRAAALALSSRISDTALTFPAAEAPGETFNYNNVNTQIAGIALENALAARGMRYADFLSERIWKPLGNGDARLWLEDDGGSPRFYAGLDAGLPAWLRIGIMLAGGGALEGNSILSEASVAALVDPVAINPSYGLGVWLGGDWHEQRRYGPSTPATVPHSAPYLAPGVVFFDGFGGQRVYVIPSEQLVIARFGEVDITYDDSVIVNTLLRGLIDARARQATAEYRGDGADALYMERFEQLLREARAGRGLKGYDPLIPLKGAVDPQPLPRADAEWLDSDTVAWLEDLGARSNSLAMMIWHDGRVVYERYYGEAGADELVVSRSLSKPVSVVASGRAMAEGFIEGFEVPLARYLFEWRGTPRGEITLGQILSMRSGLEPQGNSFEAESVMNRAYLHPYHAEVIINEYPLVTAPGSRYDYSNANGELVAPFIERATGRRYEEWLSEAVLEPLDAAGGQIWVNRIGGTVHSGCCALLPAETYLKLAVLYHQDGIWQGERLLPEGFVERIRTPTPQNVHAGMGLYVAGPYVEGRGAANPELNIGKTKHGEPYLDEDLYLFDGNSNQVVYVVPRHDLIMLRVGTAPPKDEPWDNAALPNRVLRAYADATGATLVPQPGP